LLATLAQLWPEISIPSVIPSIEFGMGNNSVQCEHCIHEYQIK